MLKFSFLVLNLVIGYQIISGTTIKNDGDMMSQEVDKLAKATLEMNSKFISKLYKKCPEESQVISVWVLMFLFGELGLHTTDQNTHELILSTLNLPDQDKIKSTFPLIHKKITSTGSIESSFHIKLVANKENKFTDQVKKEFKSTCNGQTDNVDFNKPNETAAEINSKVKLDMKINPMKHDDCEELISPDMICDDDRRIISFGGMLFKGEWENPVLDVEERDFHVCEKHTIKKLYLHQQGMFNTSDLKELDAKALHVGYNDGYCLHLIYPNSNDKGALNKIIKAFEDPDTFHKMLSKMKVRSLDVYFPHPDLCNKHDLIEMYKEEKNLTMKSNKEFQFQDIFENCELAHLSHVMANTHLKISNSENTACHSKHNSMKKKKTKTSDCEEQKECSGEDCSTESDMETVEVNKPFVFYITKDKKFVILGGWYTHPCAC